MNNKGTQTKPKESLHNRATGYSYYKDVAVKIKTQVLAEDGQTIITNEEVKIVKVKKYRKPNLNAQKKLLTKKNMDNRWTNVQEEK